MTTTTTPKPGDNAEVDRLLFYTFITAVEGGIGYWSSCATYHWTNNYGDNDADDIAGFYADIVPTEDPEDFPPSRIDRAVIARGFERLAAGPVKGLHDTYRARSAMAYQLALAGMDPSDEIDLDADDADWAVQVGLFGEVVYG